MLHYIPVAVPSITIVQYVFWLGIRKNHHPPSLLEALFHVFYFSIMQAGQQARAGLRTITYKTIGRILRKSKQKFARRETFYS